MNSTTSLISRLVSNTVFRYAFVGGTASAIDVGLLYFFTSILGFYYLTGVPIAMTVSFLVRFILQKMVTFEKRSLAGTTRELYTYSLLYVGSLLSTTILMYYFVDILGFWYLFAQVVTILLIASVSFVVYRKIIFPKGNG